MRVLGIDPGSRITGFGILESDGSHLKALSWGVIYLGKYSLPERLLKIFFKVKELVEEFRPQAIALEEVIPEAFPRAALKLGQAQGAAILAAAKQGIPLYFYHPLEIKQALTGYGTATKEQVCFVVKQILRIKEDVSLDASDALSVAIYHLQTLKQREAMCWPK